LLPFYFYPTILNADDSWTGFRCHIEDILESDILSKQAGIEINPEKTQFFLCGNPIMVESVTEFLKQFNYTKHTKKLPGALHVEEW